MFKTGFEKIALSKELLNKASKIALEKADEHHKVFLSKAQKTYGNLVRVTPESRPHYGLWRKRRSQAHRFEQAAKYKE